MGDPSDAESIASEPDHGSLVRKERRRRWQEDNRLAIASYNERLFQGGKGLLPGALDRIYDEAVTGLVVVMSIVVHGITSTPLMRWLDREP